MMLIATIATQRSGTKLLGSLFRSGAVVTSFGEIFIPSEKFAGAFNSFIQTSDSNILSYANDDILDLYFRQFSPWRVAHFDLMFNQIEIPSLSWHEHAHSGIYGYLQSRNAVVIYLDRDLFETYVSMRYLQQKGGLAHRFAGSRNFEQLTGLKLDTEDFFKYCQRVCSHRMRLRDAMDDCDYYYELNYSELARTLNIPSDLRAMIADCAIRHHGIIVKPERIQIAPPDHVPSDIDYEKAFANFGDVQTAYEQSPFANNGAAVAYDRNRSRASRLLARTSYNKRSSDLMSGTKQLKAWLERRYQEKNGAFMRVSWKKIGATINAFFARRHDKIFDDAISPGAAITIMGFMAALQPAAIIHTGGASGLTVAFIIEAAKALGLAREEEPFLYSIDDPSGQPVGELLPEAYTDHLRFWNLFAAATPLHLIERSVRLDLPEEDVVVAVLAGRREHPWPVVDIAALRAILPQKSWILIHNTHHAERCLVDCITYDTPSPAPMRGPQLAASLWPGTKWIGQESSYNMAAINLDIDDDAFARFLERAREYSDEAAFTEWGIVQSVAHRPFD